MRQNTANKERQYYTEQKIAKQNTKWLTSHSRNAIENLNNSEYTQ